MIFFNKGQFELEVKEIKDTEIVTRVVNSGKLQEKSLITIPGATLPLPILTQFDI
jgi:pyruvate kinase